MNISICITVLNEEEGISGLLDSLLNQTIEPQEIIIVDGGSTDKTIEIIRYYQRKDGRIKLLTEKCSRSHGRNLSVEVAKNEIIAMTDAGCIARPDWIHEITDPFNEPKIGISAGFYEMVGNSPLQKAEKVFLGVIPSKFDIHFLPSTRSIAFRKKVFEQIGGFPEGKGNSAEDTDFNHKALKLGVKYERVKNAVVEWGMPTTLQEFRFKIYEYAKWDAEYGTWIHPNKNLTSHNVHSLFIILRYIFAIILFIFCIIHPPLFAIFLICFLVYIFWAFKKAGLWGIVLQFVSDSAIINGFVHGIF